MSNKGLLVVAAHAADFCTRAGGTIARYSAAGWSVSVVALTFGEHGESGGYWKENPTGTLEECRALRRTEAVAAAAKLGASVEFLGLADYPLYIDEDTVRLMTRRILDLRPALILTHWKEDPLNVDHEVTSKCVVRALGAAAQRGAYPETEPHYFPAVYFFESTVPHSEFNSFRPDTYVDIDDVFDIKMDAIRRFACQPQLVDYYTHFAAHRGFQASDWARRGIKYAEAYVRYLPHVGRGLPLTERDQDL